MENASCWWVKDIISDLNSPHGVAIVLVSQPPEGYHPVGGYLVPINKLAILAPYLILACVFGAATLVFVKRKH